MVASKDVSGLITLPTIDYETARISELAAKGRFDDKGRLRVNHVMVGDRKVVPTQRFWTSLCAKFGFSPSIFRYFSHKEVFDRIAERNDSCAVKLAIQTTPAEQEYIDAETGFVPKLLAVSAPTKAMLHSDEVTQVLNRLDVTKVDYYEGRVVSSHEPRNNFGWKIGDDDHNAQFVLETPVDGYGKPVVHLALVRLLCTNMMRAIHKAFQAGIILSKSNSAMDTLQRAMEAYNNEDGFMALKTRIESAQHSWASVNECVQLGKVIKRLSVKEFRPEFLATVPDTDSQALRNNLLNQLFELSGDLREIYGVAQIDSLSEKRMRQLPSKARVYDLLCFATEIATHQATPMAARDMHEFFGRLVGSDLYDLEGSCDEYKEFADFMDSNSKNAAEARANKPGLN